MRAVSAARFDLVVAKHGGRVVGGRAAFDVPAAATAVEFAGSEGASYGEALMFFCNYAAHRGRAVMPLSEGERGGVAWAWPGRATLSDGRRPLYRHMQFGRAPGGCVVLTSPWWCAWSAEEAAFMRAAGRDFAAATPEATRLRALAAQLGGLWDDKMAVCGGAGKSTRVRERVLGALQRFPSGGGRRVPSARAFMRVVFYKTRGFEVI